jgi:hypothetical protein
MFSADSNVIPAKAGIQNPAQNVDSRFRIVRRTRRTLGNDDEAASKSHAAMFSTEQTGFKTS